MKTPAERGRELAAAHGPITAEQREAAISILARRRTLDTGSASRPRGGARAA